MPTVIATPIDEAVKEALEAHARTDEDKVLRATYDMPDESMSKVAKHLGWKTAKGEPAKMRVSRTLKQLAKDGLVLKGRGNTWVLSARGAKELNKLDSEKQATETVTRTVTSPIFLTPKT